MSISLNMNLKALILHNILLLVHMSTYTLNYKHVGNKYKDLRTASRAAGSNSNYKMDLCVSMMQ